MTRSRRYAGALLVALVAVMSAGCVAAKNPEGWASPVQNDSTVYYFPKKDRLAAAALDSAGVATARWTFPDSKAHNDQKDIKMKAVYSDPIIDGDLIYVGTYEGDVFALVQSDGSIRWRTTDRPDGSLVAGPVLAGDRLIFGTTEGRLYAVSKRDGTPAEGWPADGVKVGGSGIWAPPVVSGSVVVVATMGGSVLGYNLSDGAEAWRSPYKSSGAIADLSLLDEKHLFVPSLSHEVAILDPTDGGKQLGEVFKATNWVWTRAAFDGKLAYFGDFDGWVYGLDISTMKAWRYDAGARVKAAPGLVNGMVVVADRDAVVHFLKADTGEKLNVVPLESAGTVRAPVAVAAGRAIVATTKGKLFIADPAKLSVVPLDVKGAGQ